VSTSVSMEPPLRQEPRMHNETAFVLTVLVLCYAAVSGLVRRWYLAPALIFVVLGIVLGPACLGLIEAGPT
jgi:NhaP-type Na+/H+ or K+/H+ antiporter